MTYNTPELLSVGTAQNLVLGLDKNNTGRTNQDEGFEYKAEDAPPDDSGW